MSVEKDEHAEIIQFPTTLHVCFTFCMLTHYISFNIEAKCFENTTSMVNSEKSHQDFTDKTILGNIKDRKNAPGINFEACSLNAG